MTPRAAQAMQRGLGIGLGLALMCLPFMKAAGADGGLFTLNPSNIFTTSFILTGTNPMPAATLCVGSLNGTPFSFSCAGAPRTGLTHTFDQSAFPSLTPNMPINLTVHFESSGGVGSDTTTINSGTRPLPSGGATPTQISCTSATITVLNAPPQGPEKPGNPATTVYQVEVKAQGIYDKTKSKQIGGMYPWDSASFGFSPLPLPDAGIYTATATVTVLNSYGGPDAAPVAQRFPMSCNPVPTLFQVIPSSAEACSSDVPTLQVIGDQFMQDSGGAQILWNNAPLASTVLTGGTTIEATLSSVNLAVVGVATITVINPPFTPGPSSGLPFNITPPPTPVAIDATVPVDFNLPTTFALPAGIRIDKCPGALTYIVVKQPIHGTLPTTPQQQGLGEVTYQTTGLYVGQDSFTYQWFNGISPSNIATVTLNVGPPSIPPTAADVSTGTKMNLPVTFPLDGSDVYGLPLTYSELTGPVNGTTPLFSTDGQVTYQGNRDFTGSDTFTYQVSYAYNGTTTPSSPGLVTITVSPPIPVAVPVVTTVPFNTTTLIALSGDPGQAGLPLFFRAVTSPVYGKLSWPLGNTSPPLYTPDPWYYVGPDSFTYVVNNGKIDSGIEPVSITVLPSTSAPTAKEFWVTVNYETVAPITLLGKDPDNLPIIYSTTSLPSNGTLSGAGQYLAYAPANGFHGSDSFGYDVSVSMSNGYLTSSTATVHITVKPPPPPLSNPPPTLDSLNPGAARAGGAGFALTLIGSDFVAGATVTWNGNARATNFLNSGQLTASILESDIGLLFANSTAMVQVINLDSQPSNPLPFTILPAVITGPEDYIKVEPNGRMIYAGDTLQFTAQYFHDNSPVPGVTFAWNLNNGADGTISPAGKFAPSGTVSAHEVYRVAAAAYGISGSATVTVVPEGASLTGDVCGAIAYPVPYKSTMGLPGITFTHLAPDAEIRIYTSNARPVRTLRSVNGENVLWDLRNGDGAEVASWVYLYHIKQAGSCPTKDGKLVVIH